MDGPLQVTGTWQGYTQLSNLDGLRTRQYTRLGKLGPLSGQGCTLEASTWGAPATSTPQEVDGPLRPLMHRQKELRLPSASFHLACRLLLAALLSMLEVLHAPGCPSACGAAQIWRC